MSISEGAADSTDRFRPFAPVEVLYSFDGPRIFTLRDADGELNLACWSDEDEFSSRYVVAPTSAKILESLRRGDVGVYDALNQPRCWICDVDDDGEVRDCRRMDFDAIPRDALPALGAMLLTKHNLQGNDDSK